MIECTYTLGEGQTSFESRDLWDNLRKSYPLIRDDIFFWLGYGYIGARTNTTQHSGQTPEKEVEIKNITVYVSGYNESNTTGMSSPPRLSGVSV
jgi:hypothetical protein